MDAIRVSDGAAVDYICTGAVEAGDVIQVGDFLVGIASRSGATGEKIGLSVSGVFDIIKHLALRFRHRQPLHVAILTSPTLRDV